MYLGKKLKATAFWEHRYDLKLLRQLLFSSVVDSFILSCHSEGKSPKTISVYEGCLRRFQWYLENTDNTKYLLDLIPDHIRKFFVYLQTQKVRFGGKSTSSNRPLTLFAVHQYFRVLRTFFRWCMAEGYMPSYIMENIKPPKLPEKVIPQFSREQIQAMLSQCKPRTFLGDRNRALILFMVDTGLREEEITRLKMGDIEPKSGMVRVSGKGNKQRIVRIGQAARQALWRYLIWRRDKEEALWLTEERKPLTKGGLRTMVKNLCNYAGVNGTKCSPHTFRHTFACNFLLSGGDSLELQQLLGHSSLKMVENYIKAVKQELALKAHETHSPADRMGLK
jgi:site-specific recombinase XerD